MTPTEGVSLEKLGAEVVAWENRIADYESRPNADQISEAVRMAALIHMCPSRLREHLQLNAEMYTNYVGGLSVQHSAKDCPIKSQGGTKGKGKGGKDSGKSKWGKDSGGKKGGKSKGKNKGKSKDGKGTGNKGKGEHKPLNSVPMILAWVRSGRLMPKPPQKLTAGSVQFLCQLHCHRCRPRQQHALRAQVRMGHRHLRWVV